jgi:hypothetical protein
MQDEAKNTGYRNDCGICFPSVYASSRNYKFGAPFLCIILTGIDFIYVKFVMQNSTQLDFYILIFVTAHITVRVHTKFKCRQ